MAFDVGVRWMRPCPSISCSETDASEREGAEFYRCLFVVSLICY